MPIVEPPTAGYPLSQGDILQGVKLFVTKANGTSAGLTDYDFCMVISRPCVVAHKGQVVVAGVKAYAEGVPGTVDNVEKVLDFMTGVRDGVKSPDLFYLGQLPGQKGRYCSRLDSIHTIEVPSKPDERKRYVDQYRIAALNQDFQRALHSRIFGSFASLGFDDHAWPSDTDLDWIVNQGKADIRKKEADVEQFRATKSSSEAAGKPFTQAKELDKAESKLEELRALVAPYEAELESRKTRRALPDLSASTSPDSSGVEQSSMDVTTTVTEEAR